MRLAWFTPWPPQSSGIAGRSAALVAALSARGHGLDVFVDERDVPTTRAGDEAPPPGAVRVQSAHDFVWRVRRGHYDLIVYQIGNSRQHAFTWPYLFRWPGLVVLHDARLHHARGHALLLRRQLAEYRAEFHLSHPDVPAAAAELAIAGFDGAYYYLWPMTGAVLGAARLVACHARGAVRELASTHPAARVEYITLSSGRAEPATPDARAAARSALGYDADQVVFGVFGGLTPEKRIAQVLDAFRWTHARIPEARLLLAGTPTHPLDRQLAALGLTHAVHVRPALDDAAFEAAISAADVVVNLRWPTALETSGPWLQAIADARPTVVTELAHQAHVPALDPRTWQSWHGHAAWAPVVVAIDLMDEDHSLRLAMLRLGTDAPLRCALGAAARAYWEREHSLSRMIDDYERVIAQAAALPAPAPRHGEHPAAAGRALLQPFREVTCELF